MSTKNHEVEAFTMVDYCLGVPDILILWKKSVVELPLQKRDAFIELRKV